MNAAIHNIVIVIIIILNVNIDRMFLWAFILNRNSPMHLFECCTQINNNLSNTHTHTQQYTY